MHQVERNSRISQGKNLRWLFCVFGKNFLFAETQKPNLRSGLDFYSRPEMLLEYSSLSQT